jgi:hypothetical protein
MLWVRVQAFRDEIVDAVLAGERALFYAFGFALEGFTVQHMLNSVTDEGQVLHAFGGTDIGQRCIRIAWELSEHGCAARMSSITYMASHAWARARALSLACPVAADCAARHVAADAACGRVRLGNASECATLAWCHQLVIGLSVQQVTEIAACRMYTTTCLRYTQHEIMWGYVLFVARVLRCTDALFAENGAPLWFIDGHVLNYPRLERAPPLATFLHAERVSLCQIASCSAFVAAPSIRGLATALLPALLLV